MIGSLCSGYGGLDLAVEHITGHCVAWHAETDPAASTVLAAHWPHVPNLGDLTAITWADVDPVDILTAGYPCQPFSVAGQRQGDADDRHLWPHVAEAIRRIRPALVVLENVAGHRSMGFDRVLADLAATRYVGSWRSVRAADVGAPHGRERVFIVATNATSAATADATRIGRRGHERHRLTSVVTTSSSDDVAADWGSYQSAVQRWEHVLGRPAPTPTFRGSRGARRLSPRFVEWMMGLPDGWVTNVPGVDRNAALRMLGNGVVPAQAIAALDELLAA